MKKQDTIGSVIYHFFFALTSGVMGAIVASWPLLFFFMAIEKTNETVGMSLFKVMGNYNQLMGYLLLPWHRQLKMADFPTSANAAAHFAEVKGLFQLTALVFLLCLALHFYFQQAKRKPYLGMSQVAALIFMVVPVVVLPFAIANFDDFFRTFHTLLFHNSNWLFDPNTDPIIDVLTEGFFSACFAVGGAVYELYFAQYLISRH